jgi:ParB family chromosome partitioning protein
MNPIKKSPLGRGLDSLIPRTDNAKPTPTGTERLIDLDITAIKPNDQQPRYDFDEEALEALTTSIKEKGLLQPVIVVAQANGYMLISGERRWRASGLAGLKVIPAVVIDNVNENERLELALIENTQRDDLKPLELAKAYQELITRTGYRQEDVARIAGRSRSAVANTLRLLELTPLVMKALDKKMISEGHARVFLSVPENQQAKLLNDVISEALSVRQTEALAKLLQNDVEHKNDTAEPKVFELPGLDPNMLAIAKEMESFFESKVTLKAKGKSSGVIEIRYSSEEDLDKIVNKLRGEL